MRVTTKRDFVARYKQGEFGNASLTWDSVWSFFEYYKLEHPPDDQLFHLRNKKAGGQTLYNKTFIEIVRTTLVGDFYVSAMAPHQYTTLQGEVRRSVNGLELRYNQIKKPMREAFQDQSETVYGLRAKLLVEFYLDSNSYEWLMRLLDKYEDHIVEFSSFSVNWGTVPGHNTVFWEVRPDRQFGSNYSKHTEIY